MLNPAVVQIYRLRGRGVQLHPSALLFLEKSPEDPYTPSTSCDIRKPICLVCFKLLLHGMHPMEQQFETHQADWFPDITTCAGGVGIFRRLLQEQKS